MNKYYVDINDQYRAILTETIPYETPIIFSNDGLYIILKNEIYKKNRTYEIFFTKIINEEEKKTTTKAYKYYIPKNDNDFRIISLLHPISQIKLSKFLCKNSDLITYYCSKSNVSLRYPYKTTSIYYLKEKELADIYKYRESSKSLYKYDNFSLYSPSFFAYKEFDRIYKFINSSLFLDLESSFNFLKTIDISKCFHNIYTHSISWATKNKTFIKENLKNNPKHFADSFDKYIRSGNHNETHGIPIGPEISRVFAEIIFQKIDINIINSLEKENIVFDREYTFKRYIDDIFLFTNNKEILDKICKTISYEYSLYNLHINYSKVKEYKRPFITNKSIALNEISTLIEKINKKIYEEKSKINKIENFKIKIINELKSIVREFDLEYSDISSFVIGSISKRLRKYIKTKEDINIDIINLLFDINFFILNIVSDINSINIICNDIIYTTDKKIKKNKLFLNLYENIIKLVNKKEIKNSSSIEIINMILITKIFPINFQFNTKYIEEKLIKNYDYEHKDGEVGYFNIISSLFYIERRDKKLTKKIINIIINKIKNEKEKYSSEIHHLILDIISCRFIDRKDRVKIYEDSGLEDFFNIKPKELNKDFFELAEKNHIFTNWNAFSMHHLLFKKELNKKMLNRKY